MKIVHVISTLDSRAGGPPMVAASLARAQAGLGHAVTLVTATVAPDVTEFLPGPDVELRRFEPDGGVRKLLAPSAGAAVLSALDGADALAIHGVWEPALLAAERAARARGVPVALHAHGMLDDWALGKKAFKKKLALALAYGRLVRAARVVFANNEHEACCLRRMDLGAAVQVVPNGVDDQVLSATDARGRFRAGHPEIGDDPYVLFLSRLDPIKGLHVIAEGVALARERAEPGSRLARLHLVAAGPDSGAAEPLKRDAERLGITDSVHLTGPLYSDDKRGALADATVFALASEHESFGIVIAEAMAAARPVVVSEACHFDAVRAEDAGLIVPRTGDAYADAFTALVTDPARADAMGGRGRELVRTRYTWPAVARLTCASLESLGR